MPKALRALWDGWKRVARRIGDVQARVLLTGFYFLVLGPPALLLRWRADPLALRPGAARGWTPREAASEAALTRAHRQS
jgi:hypothetical protein